MIKKIRIGTRGSQLALWQAEKVASMLIKAHPAHEYEVVVIHTEGDKILDTSLSIIGGKGVFTKEIEDALLRCDIDIAVHSLKDLPTQLPQGLIIGAVPERHEPHDVLISRRKGTTIDDLTPGARIASGSVRRKAELLYIRPDLEIIDIRGNVNTRIRKFMESDWDGIVLAQAGVERLGMGDYISSMIPVEQMLPAVGQGAIALECRNDDAHTLNLISSIDHPETSISVKCERAYLAGLGGGCKTPIAGYARMINDELFIEGKVLSEDGTLCFEGSESGDAAHPEEIGSRLASRLLDEIDGKIVIK